MSAAIDCPLGPEPAYPICRGKDGEPLRAVDESVRAFGERQNPNLALHAGVWTIGDAPTKPFRSRKADGTEFDPLDTTTCHCGPDELGHHRTYYACPVHGAEAKRRMDAQTPLDHLMAFAAFRHGDIAKASEELAGMRAELARLRSENETLRGRLAGARALIETLHARMCRDTARGVKHLRWVFDDSIGGERSLAVRLQEFLAEGPER